VTPEPVRKQVVVSAAPGDAFRGFTDGMDGWWSRDHHWGASPLKRQLLEARIGGRWYSWSTATLSATEAKHGRSVDTSMP
jgi:hypothetical protein